MTRVRELAGHPIEQHNSPNQGGAMSGHKGVVLHIAEGTYRGTIAWQMNPNQRYASGGSVTTCSTWIVGRAEGEWAQMVDTARIAWCQRSGSRDWLSIELAGYAPGAPTAWQIEACAQLLAWAHREHGVPLTVADHPGERGLGHHSMDREWLGEEWGHDACPGSGVIKARSAIVARAQAIAAGEDDDMTREEIAAAVVVGIHQALERAAARDTPTGRQIGTSINNLLAPVLAGQRTLGELVARESTSPEEARALLAELPAPATADAIADQVLAGLGGRSPADVAQALVAAGQDPAALAAALAKLA